MQQPSRTANLSKARQRLIEVQTRIWQVELCKKSGELVDRFAAGRQSSAWFGTLGITIRIYLLVSLAWLLAERDQQRCHDILAEEVPANPRRLTRGSGNGVDDALVLHLAEPLRTKSDIDPIPRIYRTARKSSSRLLIWRIDRYPSALDHTCIHNSVLMRL